MTLFSNEHATTPSDTKEQLLSDLEALCLSLAPGAVGDQTGASAPQGASPLPLAVAHSEPAVAHSEVESSAGDDEDDNAFLLVIPSRPAGHAEVLRLAPDPHGDDFLISDDMSVPDSDINTPFLDQEPKVASRAVPVLSQPLAAPSPSPVSQAPDESLSLPVSEAVWVEKAAEAIRVEEMVFAESASVADTAVVDAIVMDDVIHQAAPLLSAVEVVETPPLALVVELETPVPQASPAEPDQLAPNELPGSDDNPFLPKHLRERLNQSKTSLLEEIARSSQALDASTALLRNFAEKKTEKPAKPPVEKQSADKPAAKPERRFSAFLAAVSAENAALDAVDAELVETLVAKYLPLIEADLRQQLRRLLSSAEFNRWDATAQRQTEPEY
jgi:hypothetical protein